MSNQYKVIFIGTSEFALPSLEKLAKADFVDLKLIITAPDKPVGRKQILTPPPVKISAEKHRIPIEQPEKIVNCKLKIENLEPDLIILTAYGQIIPKEILSIPKYGCLNIHPSLLPKYRGASPIQSVILNNEKQTGVTIMLMDEKMDHGPILAQQEWEILNPKSQTNSKFSAYGGSPEGRQIPNSKITYQELSQELAKLGADLLIETIPKWFKGEIKAIPQDHSKATFTKILKREDGKIDWLKSAEEIECQVRAFDPWPGSFAFWNNKRVKIIKVGTGFKPVPTEKNISDLKPGQIFLTDDNKLAVACGKDYLIIKELQLEGKQKTNGQAFVLGNKEIVGDCLS